MGNHADVLVVVHSISRLFRPIRRSPDPSIARRRPYSSIRSVNPKPQLFWLLVFLVATTYLLIYLPTRHYYQLPATYQQPWRQRQRELAIKGSAARYSSIVSLHLVQELPWPGLLLPLPLGLATRTARADGANSTCPCPCPYAHAHRHSTPPHPTPSIRSIHSIQPITQSP